MIGQKTGKELIGSGKQQGGRANEAEAGSEVRRETQTRNQKPKKSKKQESMTSTETRDALVHSYLTCAGVMRDYIYRYILQIVKLTGT